GFKHLNLSERARMTSSPRWVNQSNVYALALAIHDPQHALEDALSGGDITGAVERGARTGIGDCARLRLDGMDMGDVIGKEEGEEPNAAIAVERPVSPPGAQCREGLLHQHRRLRGVDLKEGASRDTERPIHHPLVHEVL